MSFSSWSLFVAACVFWTTAEADIIFPNGLFCETVCQGRLPRGSTYNCVFHRDGNLNRFIVRQVFRENNTMPWDFYFVNSDTPTDAMCNIGAIGDGFVTSNNNVPCANSRSALRNYHKRGASSLYNNNEKTRSVSQDDPGANPNQKKANLLGRSFFWNIIHCIIKAAEYVNNALFGATKNSLLHGELFDEEYKIMLMNLEMVVKHSVSRPEILCQLVLMDLCGNERMIQCDGNACCVNPVSDPVCEDASKSSLKLAVCIHHLNALLKPF